jgi:hypothetical protein
MDQRTLVVTNDNDKVQASPVVAFRVRVRHFRNASMQIQFCGESNSCKIYQYLNLCRESEVLGVKGIVPSAESAADISDSQKEPMHSARTSSKVC